jgi:predicted methyltransferase
MVVVEISPGLGWYTAVLAPTLRDRGLLVVATGDPNGVDSGATRAAQSLRLRLARNPAAFDRVKPIAFGPPWSLGPAESADMVLTFRNLHNWLEAGVAEDVLAAAYAVLRHGGVLGLTDHRAPLGASISSKTIADTGYVPEGYAIALAKAAGFRLAGRSEINANPRDTKDYPNGVWSLPPTYAGADLEHRRYAAIGESDRMTLKFVKP